LTRSEAHQLVLCTFPGLKLRRGVWRLRYRRFPSLVSSSAPHFCRLIESLWPLQHDKKIFYVCSTHTEICFMAAAAPSHNCRNNQMAKTFAKFSVVTLNNGFNRELWPSCSDVRAVEHLWAVFFEPFSNAIIKTMNINYL